MDSREILQWSAHVAPTIAGLLLIGAFASGCHAQHPDPIPAPETTQDATRSWIGTHHPPLPQGATFLGGATVGTTGQTNYVFDEVIIDDQYQLWLSRRDDETERRMYIVRDVLVVPEHSPDMLLQYGICGMLREGAPATPEAEDLVLDPEIVALVPWDEEPGVVTEIQQAWRAERESGTFVPLSRSRLGCLNMGNPHPWEAWPEPERTPG